MKNLILPTALILALTGGVICNAAAAALTLGVHPYLPAAEIKARFRTLAVLIQEEIGRPVEVRVGETYQKHIEVVGNDGVDIAFLGPMSYVTMAASFGSKPLLGRLETSGTPCLTGRIVVRSDSPLRKIGDLKGTRIAFVTKESTMGFVVPMYMLVTAGAAPPPPYSFLGTHEDVAMGVLAGDYDAGCVKEEVWDHFAPMGLVSIAQTPCISEHLFVTSTTLNPGIIIRLRRLLLGLSKTARGRRALESISSSATAVIHVKDSDYDTLREMIQALKREGVNQ